MQSLAWLTWILSLVLATTSCGARTSLPDGTSASMDGGIAVDAAHPGDASPPDAKDCSEFSPASPIPIAATDDPFAVPVALRIVDPYVYVGVFITTGEDNGTGYVYRVPTEGGTVEVLEEKQYNYGPIESNGTYLFFPQAIHANSTAYHAAVMARPLSGGTSFALPNPTPPDGLITISGVTAGSDGAVYWLVHPDAGGTVLARWNGEESSVLTQLSSYFYELRVTDTHAFLQGPQSLLAIPTSGGQGETVRSLQASSDLLGTRGEVLFFTVDGTSILRREPTGAEMVIQDGTVLQRRPNGGRVPAWVDDEWLFYSEQSGPSLRDRLVRIPSGGGGGEVIAELQQGVVEAISGDACNVYWLETRVPGPSTLMVRAIEP